MYHIVRALCLRFFPASRAEYVVDLLLGLINVVEAFTIPQLTQTYPRNVNQPDIYIYSVTVYTVHTALLKWSLAAEVIFGVRGTGTTELADSSGTGVAGGRVSRAGEPRRSRPAITIE